MAGEIRHSGGLVGLNTGLISDCYSKIRLHHVPKALLGGLCGENRGTILRCIAQGTILGRGRKSGLCGRQNGSCTQSFWLRNDQEKQNAWQDWEQSISKQALSPDSLVGWYLTQVWQLQTDPHAPSPLKLYHCSEQTSADAQVMEIQDQAGLLHFARQVNDGSLSPDTVVRLTADLDLGGRVWTPVGLDTSTPFSCCFDGGGHQIRNFVLRAGKHPFSGFFGCIGPHGEVKNLNIECLVLGQGSCSAPLRGLNQGAVVNCTATSSCDLSRCTGGLVAQNSGTITRCAALGRMGKKSPLPWWATALLLFLLCLPLPIYFSLTAQTTTQEVFAPVILDPNAQPIDPNIQPQPEEVTDTSASFIMNAEMYVSVQNYAGSIGLRCPTWSTRGFVATVRLSQADQARIGYSGEADFIPLYQSGLIAPGYGVEVITLQPLPDGRKLPAGHYELSVLLEFYDVATNEKSTVNTVIPLEVTVG